MTWISLSRLHYRVIWHFCILTSQQVVVHNSPTCFPAISPLCIKVDVSNIQPLFCQSKNVIVWPSVSFGYVLLFPWGFFFFTVLSPPTRQSQHARKQKKRPIHIWKPVIIYQREVISVVMFVNSTWPEQKSMKRINRN